MIGPLINGSAIIIGGVLGISLSRFIPQRLRDGLPPAFAMISIAMGITLVVKVHQLPAVALAVVLGVALGELLRLEHGIQLGGIWIQQAASGRIYTEFYRLDCAVLCQRYGCSWCVDGRVDWRLSTAGDQIGTGCVYCADFFYHAWGCGYFYRCTAIYCSDVVVFLGTIDHAVHE